MPAGAHGGNPCHARPNQLPDDRPASRSVKSLGSLGSSIADGTMACALAQALSTRYQLAIELFSSSVVRSLEMGTAQEFSACVPTGGGRAFSRCGVPWQRP
jgi:hypothetical protein